MTKKTRPCCQAAQRRCPIATRVCPRAWSRRVTRLQGTRADGWHPGRRAFCRSARPRLGEECPAVGSDCRARVTGPGQTEKLTGRTGELGTRQDRRDAGGGGLCRLPGSLSHRYSVRRRTSSGHTSFLTPAHSEPPCRGQEDGQQHAGEGATPQADLEEGAEGRWRRRARARGGIRPRRCFVPAVSAPAWGPVRASGGTSTDRR